MSLQRLKGNTVAKDVGLGLGERGLRTMAVMSISLVIDPCTMAHSTPTYSTMLPMRVVIIYSTMLPVRVVIIV